jgi:sn-glycerol 3-phosphate transport system ATP-binding protein
MRAGRIEHDGAPSDLYERPATVFTARFIGAPPMNILSGALLSRQARLTTSLLNGRDPAAVMLGVRPETLRIADQGLQAQVVAAEYLGADTQVETRVGDERWMVRLPGRFTATPGQTIHLDWDGRDTHWFDATSHCRLA